jgi:O-antigen/teichoic acid export membrane protein
MAALNLIRGSFWRSVGWVLTGTAVAQIVPVLSSLVIARQYLPSEFGTFAGWLGVVSVLAVMLTGRFETSLAVMEDGEPRRFAVISTLYTVILATLAVSLLLLLWLVMGAPALFPWGMELQLNLVLFVIPVALLAAFSETWQSWAAAEGKFRYLSVIRITQAFSIVVLQIGFGELNPTADMLAIAHGMGVLVSLFVAWLIMPLGYFPDKLFPVVLEFWRAQHRFPKLSLPAGVINTVAAQLPILIVATRFGADVAGLLAMTVKVLGAPIGLLGRAVLDVFKRHASEAFRTRGECRAEYLRMFKVLGLASIAFSCVMFFISESLFALVFGENWRVSGTIAFWMLPLFAMRFMASPLSYMVYIVGKQHLDLIWQVVLLMLTIFSLSLFQPYSLSLQIYSIGYGLLYVIYLLMSYHFSLGDSR